MPVGNVFDKINTQYYELTSAEKKVADYVVIHQQQTQFMSISELAEEAGVAEATISRFCRRLGYKGYGAFKLAIANATAVVGSWLPQSGEVCPADSVEEMARKVYENDLAAMSQTRELIDPEAIRKAADLIMSAARVLCMGAGGVHDPLPGVRPPVLHRAAQFHRRGGFPPPGHRRRPAHTGGPGDLFLLLRLHRGPGAESAHRPGAEGPGHSGHPLSQVPRLGLCRRGAPVRLPGGPLQGGSVAARVAQLYLLDVLFEEVCRRDPEGAHLRREAMAEALSDRHCEFRAGAKVKEICRSKLKRKIF